MNKSQSDLRHRQVEVEGVSIHVVEGGTPGQQSILFLHGWPEDWSSYEQVMLHLSDSFHVVAIDMPGIGLSEGTVASNDKRTLARYVDGIASALAIKDVILVGGDLGAQIVYAYLHAYPGKLKRAVMMNGAVPGVDPWSEVVRNPHIWHMAFHAIPKLPELLVADHIADYFAFFYDFLAGPRGISADARRAYEQAYSTPTALRTGFEWYRAFPQDEKDNLSVKGYAVSTPVLYVRGEVEPVDVDAYLSGFRASGIENIRKAIIANSGHFVAHEQPGALAETLRQFIGSRA